MAWYDNEWGFSNRMLDNTMALFDAEKFYLLRHHRFLRRVIE
jgi:hypothetical protein